MEGNRGPEWHSRATGSSFLEIFGPVELTGGCRSGQGCRCATSGPAPAAVPTLLRHRRHRAGWFAENHGPEGPTYVVNQLSVPYRCYNLDTSCSPLSKAQPMMWNRQSTMLFSPECPVFEPGYQTRTIMHGECQLWEVNIVSIPGCPHTNYIDQSHMVTRPCISPGPGSRSRQTKTLDQRPSR